MRRCRSCQQWLPDHDFAGPTARACDQCRHEKTLRRCGRCKQRAPIDEFASPRVCRDCAGQAPPPRTCRRCRTLRPVADFGFRASICSTCRANDDDKPRACMRCLTTKPADAFDHGPSGRRRRSVCRDCLTAEAETKRRRREERRATWETDDGYVRRCYKCEQIKPVLAGFYRIHAHINGLSAYSYECRSCQLERMARRYRALLKDPERAAQLRARKAEQQRQWRERNRERASAIQRAYRKRMMADSDRHQRWLESQRIAYHLRRERDGHELPAADGHATSWVYLPIAPLYNRIVIPRLAMHLRAAIGAIARDRTPRLTSLPDMTDRAAVRRAIEIAAGLGFPSVGPVAESLGVSERTINAWVRGERPKLRSSVVEEILLRVDMFWWEVYEPGEDGYELARTVFEGDETDTPQRAAA